MNKLEDFALANRAYELMSLQERAIVLTIFASLKYPAVIDRFYEAVYRVVRSASAQSVGAVDPDGGETTA